MLLSVYSVSWLIIILFSNLGHFFSFFFFFFFLLTWFTDFVPTKIRSEVEKKKTIICFLIYKITESEAKKNQKEKGPSHQVEISVFFLLITNFFFFFFLTGMHIGGKKKTKTIFFFVENGQNSGRRNL